MALQSLVLFWCAGGKDERLDVTSGDSNELKNSPKDDLARTTRLDSFFLVVDDHDRNSGQCIE
jgi:hypothetical protein